MNTIHLEPSQVPVYLKAGYTGKTFRARVCEIVTIPAEAGLWSGGSRETYQAIELATGRAVPASDDMSSPFSDNRKECTIALRSGFAVVASVMFQGKDLGLTFYVHPDDATKLLPASTDELTDTEKKVLAVIRGLKSSYRAEQFNRLGIQGAELEAIKASLAKRDYLNKAGAITVKGRNASSGVNPY